MLALADSLEAGPVDVERLLVAAGLCPESIVRLGGWDQSLGDIAAVLADDRPDLGRPRRASRAAADRGGALAERADRRRVLAAQRVVDGPPAQPFGERTTARDLEAVTRRPRCA